MRHGNRSEYLVNINRLLSSLSRCSEQVGPPNVIIIESPNRTGAAPWLPCSLFAAVLLVTRCTYADSYWQGGKGGFNVAGSWNPSGGPAGGKSITECGFINVGLIRPGGTVLS